MQNRRWQKSETDILKQFFSDTPICELQKMLPGRTRQAIRTKASYLGLKKEKRVTGIYSRQAAFFGQPEVIEQIRQEYANENITLKQLSLKYEVSVALIQDIVSGRRYHNAGGPITTQDTLSSVEISAIREQRLSGMSLKEVAERYDISVSMVSRITLGNRHSGKPGPLVEKPWGFIVR